MAKRKRGNDVVAKLSPSHAVEATAPKVAKTNGHIDVKTTSPVIQIVAGSYERVLHGITATISESASSVQFADTFLFNAHASAIRCLALSPLPEANSVDSQGVYLATGGSDERVNVYSLSAAPILESDKVPSMPSLGKSKISENPRNRELGSLMQHSSSITSLHFPTRSKLLSGSEDNSISISRLKDLTPVSTIQAPRPKAAGQPSGDTAPQGATPAGVNDFAVHPSMKLMVSVGRGERCMRLWNLVTGKKAGVLNFSRGALQGVKESKYSSGEGRKIEWSRSGEEFAVAFERGVVVFGADSKPKCKILPQPLTKLHQISYITVPEEQGDRSILAVSTEDGRIVFYDTEDIKVSTDDNEISDAIVLGQLGGKSTGVSGRVKNFEILSTRQPGQSSSQVFVVTAGSDGSIRVWRMSYTDLSKGSTIEKLTQLGTLIGTYDSGNRITCMAAFVMLPAVDSDAGLSEFEGLTDDDGDESSSDEDT